MTAVEKQRTLAVDGQRLEGDRSSLEGAADKGCRRGGGGRRCEQDMEGNIGRVRRCGEGAGGREGDVGIGGCKTVDRAVMKETPARFRLHYANHHIWRRQMFKERMQGTVFRCCKRIFANIDMNYC